MLVRLIDVVLILLFGFIAISEVAYRSQIDLPDSDQTPHSYPDKEEILIIGIMPNGLYLVEEETMAISNMETMQHYIQKKKREYEAHQIEMRIRIRSAWNAPIKYMMALGDLCDELGIPKGMDVEIPNR